MRFLFLAVSTCLVLTACGKPQANQADNAQTGVGNDQNAVAADPSSPPGKMILFAGPVNGADAVKAMHDRHEGMEMIGKTNKAIKRELDGSSPDMASVRSAAAKIDDLARQASRWFPVGTGPDVGKTGAKPEIWQNGTSISTDFVNKLSAFQTAAQALNNSTAGNDVNAVKSRFADLGNSCKACHDKYRSEMHH